MGQRISGGLRSIVAAATTTALHTISGVAKRAIIKKIRVNNQTGVACVLQIGYDTLAAVWTPVFADFDLLQGENSWGEDELPIAGNTPEGFQIDTTAVTGFAGVLSARSTVAGAAPADVEVQIEVEEI